MFNAPISYGRVLKPQDSSRWNPL